MDQTKVCRICLNERLPLINLFDTNNAFYKEHKVKFDEIWLMYFGVSICITDNYSKEICQPCCDVLINFHNLRRLHDQSSDTVVHIYNESDLSTSAEPLENLEENFNKPVLSSSSPIKPEHDNSTNGVKVDLIKSRNLRQSKCPVVTEHQKNLFNKNDKSGFVKQTMNEGTESTDLIKAPIVVSKMKRRSCDPINTRKKSRNGHSKIHSKNKLDKVNPIIEKGIQNLASEKSSDERTKPSVSQSLVNFEQGVLIQDEEKQNSLENKLARKGLKIKEDSLKVSSYLGNNFSGMEDTNNINVTKKSLVSNKKHSHIKRKSELSAKNLVSTKKSIDSQNKFDKPNPKIEKLNENFSESKILVNQNLTEFSEEDILIAKYTSNKFENKSTTYSPLIEMAVLESSEVNSNLSMCTENGLNKSLDSESEHSDEIIKRSSEIFAENLLIQNSCNNQAIELEIKFCDDQILNYLEERTLLQKDEIDQESLEKTLTKNDLEIEKTVLKYENLDFENSFSSVENSTLLNIANDNSNKAVGNPEVDTLLTDMFVIENADIFQESLLLNEIESELEKKSGMKSLTNATFQSVIVNENELCQEKSNPSKFDCSFLINEDAAENLNIEIDLVETISANQAPPIETEPQKNQEMISDKNVQSEVVKHTKKIRRDPKLKDANIDYDSMDSFLDVTIIDDIAIWEKSSSNLQPQKMNINVSVDSLNSIQNFLDATKISEQSKSKSGGFVKRFESEESSDANTDILDSEISINLDDVPEVNGNELKSVKKGKKTKKFKNKTKVFFKISDKDLVHKKWKKSDVDCSFVAKMKTESLDLSDVNSPLFVALSNYLETLSIIFPPYVCKWCAESFDNGRKFQKHVVSSHVQINCPSCLNNKIYENDPCLFGHIVKCAACSTSFSTPKEYRIHRTIHHRRQSCQYCKKVVERHEWFDHLKKSHSLCRHQAKQGKCQLCKNAGKTPREKSFKCHVCKMSFSTNDYLRNHLLRHKNKDVFQCDVCRKSFALKQYLATHKEIHEAKDHVCEVCKKVFSTTRNLRVHMYAHLHPDRFKCTICDKGFAIRRTLKKHLEGHRKRIEDPTRKFKCNLCTKSYRYKHALKKHLLTKH